MDARSCRFLAPKRATVFLSVLSTKRALSSNPLVPHRRAGVTMSVQVGVYQRSCLRLSSESSEINLERLPCVHRLKMAAKSTTER